MIHYTHSKVQGFFCLFFSTLYQALRLPYFGCHSVVCSLLFTLHFYLLYHLPSQEADKFLLRFSAIVTLTFKLQKWTLQRKFSIDKQDE